ncbi:inositol monophosphatase [Frigidibacter sp. RF13]|uniref:inositol monophosphatase family protein n=1 Tax=Frigidibacter sp. RF13 TaxID=2997340 RepID=UPI00226EC4D9|nr:inositol monophosphatase family protein [Frigidibacter sp. RF13]MCY1128341.1 inositol monophosphatase [Frigidibacter sp. RF13]
MTDLAARYTAARQIAATAGALALDYFRKWDQLTIDVKGHQDFVSEADRSVELAVRAELARAFPGDGIVGEEGAPTPGSSGYTWVIDPIDGTTNFVNGIPQWCVIIACVYRGQTVIGVVHDPVHDEMHHAIAGGGAFCNDRAIHCSAKASLREGSLGVGFSGRTHIKGIKQLVSRCCDEGTVFWRNGSGGLSLAYVASGRILGYVEEHMNAWDFLAGHLIVAEAGGRVEPVDADEAIVRGGRVVVAGAGVYDAVSALAKAAYDV